jgi:hypothetical protein
MPREVREVVPCVSILGARSAGARSAAALSPGVRSVGDARGGSEMEQARAARDQVARST